MWSQTVFTFSNAIMLVFFLLFVLLYAGLAESDVYSGNLDTLYSSYDYDI